MKTPRAKYGVFLATTDICQQNYAPNGSLCYSRHRTFDKAVEVANQQNHEGNIYTFVVGEYNPKDSNRDDGYVLMGDSAW